MKAACLNKYFRGGFKFNKFYNLRNFDYNFATELVFKSIIQQQILQILLKWFPMTNLETVAEENR